MAILLAQADSRLVLTLPLFRASRNRSPSCSPLSLIASPALLELIAAGKSGQALGQARLFFTRGTLRRNYCLRLSSGPEIVLATPLIAEPATPTPVSTTMPATPT